MTTSPRGDATEVLVEGVTVPKIGQKTLLATPGCHREASRRGCRAEVRPKHRQETGLTPVPDSLATCLYPRSGSVEGPRAKGSIDVPFATPECLWSTCAHGPRAKDRSEDPLRHSITCIRWVQPTSRVRGSIHLSESSAVRCHRSS